MLAFNLNNTSKRTISLCLFVTFACSDGLTDLSWLCLLGKVKQLISGVCSASLNDRMMASKRNPQCIVALIHEGTWYCPHSYYQRQIVYKLTFVICLVMFTGVNEIFCSDF
jgi:hypothetical protein